MKSIVTFLFAALAFSAVSQPFTKIQIDSIFRYLESDSVKKPNIEIGILLQSPKASDSLKLRLYEKRFTILVQKNFTRIALKALVDQGIMLEHLGAPNDKPLLKFKEAYAIAEKINDTSNMVWSALRISKHYLNTGSLNTTDELKYTNFVVDHIEYRKHKELVFLAYNHLANRALRFYDFKTALEYYRQAYEIARKSGSELHAIEIGGNILNLKNKYQDTTGVTNFIHEIESIEGSKYSIHLANFYLNLAEFRFLFNLPQRQNYLNSALAIIEVNSENTLTNKVLLISCKLLAEESNASLLRAKLDVFWKELQTTPPTQLYYYPSEIETLEGQYYLLMGDEKTAIYHFLQSLKQAENIEAPVLFAPIYQELYRTYYSLEDYKNAYKYLEAYNTQVDKVFALNKVSEIESLIIQYETKKKQQTITALEKERELTTKISKEKSRANGRLQVFLIVLSILMVFLIYLYLQNRIKAKKLAQLNQFKDTTFSVLSHDLRSPLNTFKSLLTISSRKELTTEDYKKYLDVIKYEVNNTSEFLENILHWAQINQGNLPTKPQNVNVTSVINEIYAIVKATFKSKNIDFILENNTSNSIYIDRELFSFIVRNLIFNAYKFSPKSSSIQVILNQTAEETTIKIKDSGVGMSTEQIEAFYKGNLSASPDSSGEKSTGIGLMLCKDFAKSLNIKILVESQLNKGSTFSVIVPRKKGG